MFFFSICCSVLFIYLGNSAGHAVLFINTAVAAKVCYLALRLWPDVFHGMLSAHHTHPLFQKSYYPLPKSCSTHESFLNNDTRTSHSRIWLGEVNLIYGLIQIKDHLLVTVQQKQRAAAGQVFQTCSCSLLSHCIHDKGRNGPCF